jgi:hypothetical protein
VSAARCGACHEPPRHQARFCATCGAPVPQAEGDAAPGASVLASPPTLADLANHPGADPVTQALLRAAADTHERVPVVAIAGDAQRGRTTVARFLGPPPTNDPAPFRVEQLPVLPTVPSPDGTEYALLPLATLVVVCLNATQLLTAHERDAVRLHVVPAGLPLALVVTRMDATGDEGAAVLARAERFARTLPGRATVHGASLVDGTFRCDGLAEMIAAACDEARTTEGQASQGLRALESARARVTGQAAHIVPASPAVPEAPPPSSAETRARVGTAWREAAILLDARVHAFSEHLPAVVASLPPERLRTEGVTEVVRGFEDLAAHVLNCFESGSATEGGYDTMPPSKEVATGGRAVARRTAPPLPVTTVERPTVLVPRVLTMAAVATLGAVSGPAGWIGAGALLGGAWGAHTSSRADFERDVRDDAVRATRAWLESARAQLHAELLARRDARLAPSVAATPRAPIPPVLDLAQRLEAFGRPEAP